MVEKQRNSDVLLVIPCLDEETHLPELLNVLLTNAEGALIVVADGGSKDQSRAIVSNLARSHTNLLLLDNPRRTQSAAMNLAVRRFGQGRKWLVRVDAHSQYPDRFLDRLRRAVAETHATSVVVPMVTRGHTCFQKAAAAAQNSVLGTGGSPHRHLRYSGWVDHGHHALFDIRQFMAVGGYDESFAANEDAELDRRLVAAGGRIWMETQAAITYFPRRTIRALFRQYRNYGRGRARNLRRHRAMVKLRQLLPMAVVPAIFFGLLGLALTPFWPAAIFFGLPALAWLTATIGGGGLIGLRTRSVCDAGAGVAAITMHAGWSLGFVEEMLKAEKLSAPPEAFCFEAADLSDKNFEIVSGA